MKSCQHIGGERLQLEPDIKRQQITGRHHHAHAQRRQHEQHRIFEPAGLGRRQIGQGHQHRGRRGRQDEHLEERRETIGDIKPTKRRLHPCRLIEQGQAGDADNQHGDPGQRFQHLVAAAESAEHQGEQRAGGQHGFGAGNGNGGEGRVHGCVPSAATGVAVPATSVMSVGMVASARPSRRATMAATPGFIGS